VSPPVGINPRAADPSAVAGDRRPSTGVGGLRGLLEPGGCGRDRQVEVAQL